MEKTAKKSKASQQKQIQILKTKQKEKIQNLEGGFLKKVSGVLDKLMVIVVVILAAQYYYLNHYDVWGIRLDCQIFVQYS